jgi:hypothetical protein
MTRGTLRRAVSMTSAITKVRQPCVSPAPFNEQQLLFVHIKIPSYPAIHP